MPRKAKTETGHPAQARPDIPPQTYGEGVEMTNMTAAMPIPDRTPAPPVAPPMDSPVTGASPVPPDSAERPDLMAIAQQMAGDGGLLGQPTNRPSEPLTAGLNSGPGPGSEILFPKVYGNPSIEMLERLSMETKDPYFAGLALRVRG